MPATSDEAPLNTGCSFVQRIRLGELLVEHEPTVRSCDAQHVWCLAAARVELVMEPLGATCQD